MYAWFEGFFLEAQRAGLLIAQRRKAWVPVKAIFEPQRGALELSIKSPRCGSISYVLFTQALRRWAINRPAL